MNLDRPGVRIGVLRPQRDPHDGGDWFRLRALRQEKRAEEADVVPRISRRKPISAKVNRADLALAA